MLKHVLVVLVLVALTSVACSSEPDKKRTVNVAGDADVLVKPDIVTLTLGIETSSPVLLTAKTQNDANTSRVLDAAVAAGVPRDQLKTDYLRIEPRYYDYPRRDFLGYFVQRNVVVELRDVSRFEELLSSVLEAGANYVHGIDFRTSELRKHRDRARSLAIKAASEKATALASDLGQTVGQPLDINEASNWWQSSYSSSWGSGSYSNVAQNAQVQMSSPGSAADSDSALEPGKIRINARVQVTFELQATSGTLTGVPGQPAEHW
jgi:uncharacterized protein YggE